MEYQDFCRLLDGGETQSCIFKKECNAFTGSISLDAELAKEIIALANNASADNYIIIGVSNDGNFHSVNNPNLTDEKLQEFCRQNIAPVPVVYLERLSWDNTPDGNLQNKLLVVIKVEAQSRQCFRFNREFYNPNSKCFYKKNEVWVRNYCHTDLATPEDIKKLFEKKVNNPTSKVNFARLQYGIAVPYLLEEAEQLVTRSGGKLFSDIDPFIVRGGPSLFHHVVIPVNGQPLLLRLVPVEKCTEKGQISTYSSIYLTFEHGILLISLGEVAEIAADHAIHKSKEDWGWFCTHEFWHSGLKDRSLNIPVPLDVKSTVGEPSSLCFVFANITNSDSFRYSWANLINSLNDQTELSQIVETNRQKINIVTSTYLEEGCPVMTNKTYRPKILLGNELYDPKRYGNVLLNRQPEICQALKLLLEKLSFNNHES